MSKLSETLADLIADSDLTQNQIADKIGIPSSCLTDYLLDKHQPTVEHLIKIADYYKCSTDYLLGREPEDKKLTFKQCPPFPQQLKYLKKHFSCSSYRIYNGTKISKSAYYSWLRGAHKPTLDNIIDLAEVLGCRVDFILGRES